MDPKCKELHFDEPNIKLVVGDVNSKIIKYSKFDIILDDGSHNSDDVVGAGEGN